MPDVRAMHELLSHFADKRELLPRSISELYENLQQFYVLEQGPTIIGTCALYVTWDNLAEVKALAVHPDFQGKGYGKKLLLACLKEARQLGIDQVFTLTLRAGFFERFGFQHVSKDKLPHKVWTECVKCVFFPDRCVEYAMVKALSPKAQKKLAQIVKQAPQPGWAGAADHPVLPQASLSLVPTEPDPSKQEPEK